MRSNQGRDEFGDFLRKIGQYEVLTADQEIVLGRAVQAWLSGDGSSPDVVAAGHRARKKMIVHNLRLVVSIAKRYRIDGITSMSIMDLVSEGSIGLATAAEKFDPTRGYKFSTYAYWWIRQAITRAISQQGRAIRLPIHMGEKISAVRKAACKFAQREGRSATTIELAAELEVAVDQLSALLDFTKESLSLDLFVRGGEEADTPLGALIADETAIDPVSAVARQQRSEVVDWFMKSLRNNLSPLESQIIHMRFWEGLTTGEIGHLLGEPIEVVRAANARALRKIRIKGRQVLDRDLITC